MQLRRGVTNAVTPSALSQSFCPGAAVRRLRRLFLGVPMSTAVLDQETVEHLSSLAEEIDRPDDAEMLEAVREIAQGPAGCHRR